MAHQSPHLATGLASEPVKLLDGESGTPLASVDIAWLRMDDPTNLMHVQGVLPLGGHVPWDDAAKVFAERLTKIPRFRQRIARDGDGRLLWVDDAEFDLHRHLVEERIGESGDDAALAAAIERHLERDFDFAHPLWEFRLLQGHRDGTVLFGKVHHVIGDGVALVTVILALTDLGPDDSATTTLDHLDSAGANPFFEILMRRGAAELAEARAIAERVMPELVRLMVAPAEAYAKVNPLLLGAGSTGSFARLLARPSDPKTRFKGALGRAKKVAWTDRIPLADVKAVGKQHGGTINDVLNAAMVGGLRRYLARDGEPPESLAFRAAMPVNLRPLEEMADLGNRFGLIFLRLPVGVRDPHRRLELMRERSAALKRSTEPLVVLKILQAIGALPEWVHSAVLTIFASKATAVFTNVPGPRNQLGFAGHPIRDIYFWVPQAGRVGLGVSILSYDGHVRMGVGTDAGLVPDPQRIIDGFHAELDALRGG